MLALLAVIVIAALTILIVVVLMRRRLSKKGSMNTAALINPSYDDRELLSVCACGLLVTVNSTGMSWSLNNNFQIAFSPLSNSHCNH